MELKDEFLEMIDEVNGFCAELQTFNTQLKTELNSGTRPKDIYLLLYDVDQARNMLSSFLELHPNIRKVNDRCKRETKAGASA